MRWLGNQWLRLVRFGFRLLYNELAFTYDSVSWVVSLGEWRCWQQAVFEFLPPPDHGLVLELAHGTGNLQLDLAQRGFQSTGLDLSAAMGQIASRKLKARSYDMRLVRGSGRALAFADGAYSTIVSTFPSGFILHPDTLLEICRLLDQGGRLIIVYAGSFTRRGVLSRFLDLLYWITGQRSNQTQEGTTRLTKYFNDAGFVLRFECASCRRSEAHLIIAEKKASTHSDF